MISGSQVRSKIAIKLDDSHCAGAFQQRLGECHQPWANLHNGLTGTWIDGMHDMTDDGIIGQKVLTEALAGDMFHDFLLCWLAVFHISLATQFLKPGCVSFI